MFERALYSLLSSLLLGGAKVSVDRWIRAFEDLVELSSRSPVEEVYPFAMVCAVLDICGVPGSVIHESRRVLHWCEGEEAIASTLGVVLGFFKKGFSIHTSISGFVYLAQLSRPVRSGNRSHVPNLDLCKRVHAVENDVFDQGCPG
jgi:hypothetical protein